MTVYFFETTNSTPHFETSLELAKKHLDLGHTVFYYYLGQAAPFLDFGDKPSFFRPFFCLPEYKVKGILKHSNFNYSIISDSKLYFNFKMPDIDSIAELRGFTYKGYSCGLSSLSSLVSILKESQPDINEHKNLLNRIIKSGIFIYEFIHKILLSKKPDLVYLYNGRFANNRAILDACIELGTPFLIHERGANRNKYSLRNYMPHDLKRVKEEIINFTLNVGLNQLKEIASHFYEDRRNGVEQSWRSFIKEQTKGLSIGTNVLGKKVITYFSSSEDEYVAVGDIVKWDRWPNQYSAIKDLISIIKKYSNLELIIRIHPHLSFKARSELKFYHELEVIPNLKLIWPDDKVDSYEQLEKSDVIVTCGSTVGIESVYWGKPSICLGPSRYDHLDAVYLPTNKEELEALLLKNDLIVDSSKSFPYGYYSSLYGVDFKYYTPETLFSGKFLGIDLHKSGFCYSVRRFVSFFILPLKIFKRFFIKN
jgi:hypothetical protein